MIAQQFIASGIIEAYCLGVASRHQITEVILMALFYPEVKAEIEIIHKALHRVRCKEVILTGHSSGTA